MLHISLVSFLADAAMIIIFGFFWRTLAIKFSDRPIGQAMAYIY